jgi:hypothetical protein
MNTALRSLFVFGILVLVLPLTGFPKEAIYTFDVVLGALIVATVLIIRHRARTQKGSSVNVSEVSFVQNDKDRLSH